MGLALFAAATLTGAQGKSDSLSAREFVGLIQDCSEEGGYFFSDNFTSNEDSYLTIVETMKKLGATGGAYVGVGPEQNFTYIAKVRPRIAFIVDIRRQAMIQHLMYKAIFQLAPTRAQFLSILLSRPIPAGKAPGCRGAAGRNPRAAREDAGRRPGLRGQSGGDPQGHPGRDRVSPFGGRPDEPRVRLQELPHLGV